METEKQLNDIVMSIAVQVVTITTALNGELHSELQKMSNIPQDIYAVNSTWFDIAYFGLFIFRRKNPHLRLPEERDKIDPILKKDFIFAVTNIGFNFKQNDELRKKFEQSMETDGFYERQMKEYSDYRGDISLLLKDRLWNAFNGEKSTSKLKFIEDSLISKWGKDFEERSKSKLPWKHVPKEKMDELLKQALRKKGIEFALPESNLIKVAKGIYEEFEEAELIKSE